MNDWRFPDDLQDVEARLRAGRAQLDPSELDQQKHRLIARQRARPRRVTFMKSRIASVLTALALGVGATGAVAVAANSSHTGSKGDAAETQYRPGKGCGDRNHVHLDSASCPGQPGKHHGDGQGDKGKGGEGDKGTGGHGDKGKGGEGDKGKGGHGDKGKGGH